MSPKSDVEVHYVQEAQALYKMFTGIPKGSRVTNALGNTEETFRILVRRLGSTSSSKTQHTNSNSTEWLGSFASPGMDTTSVSYYRAGHSCNRSVCSGRKSNISYPYEKTGTKQTHTCGRVGLSSLPSNSSSPLNELEFISHCLS